MRQLFLIVSVLLLGLSWAAAQQGAPGAMGNTGQSSAATGQTTVEGCLSGSNGSYTLTAKNGSTYQLTGDTAKLSDHVGHEVKVTGTTSAATPSSNGASGTMSSQTLEVTSVKHVSKSCKASGGTPTMK
jgi:uncharacterized protein DUF5818